MDQLNRIFLRASVMIGLISFQFMGSSSRAETMDLNMFSKVVSRQMLSTGPLGAELVVGQGPKLGWRAIIETERMPRQIIWDSYSLRDPFFAVEAPDWFDASSEDGFYEIMFHGCAPHQCSDGRVGIALFSEKYHKLYVEHVIFQDNGQYLVQFKPLNPPPEVRAKLEHAACKDAGLTATARLPFQCS